MAAPLARTVVKDLAAEHGACLRPVQLCRTEIDTGHVEQVLIPCGHTLASVCPSYGRVGEDGAPADPDTYDYTRAARDALHFAALFDRFIQNLRRFTGYDLQYFAAIEPQRRLAPHIHLAIRGTISRAELREVIQGPGKVI